MSKDAVSATSGRDRRRWLVLIALSLSVLMIVLDGTIVYVALPSIRLDLQLSETSLVWIVSAYMLAYSGCLLLAGRLGDLFGHRRVLLIGIAIFTVASLACGLANTSGLLVAGRAAQGVGGAVVSAVALSLIMEVFEDPAERAKAMGFFSFILVGGGSIGLLIGGVLTSALDWHWIFLVNLPVCVAAYAVCRAYLPDTRMELVRGRVDVAGAVTVTGGLVLATYAIVNGNQVGWVSAQTLWVLGCAAALLVLFVVIESRVTMPLIPLRFFRTSNVTASSLVRVLWAVSGSAGFFIALYIQLVLGRGPMEIGLAFLPGNLILGAFSLGLSARIVTQFGISRPLSIGLLLSALGFVLLARLPVDGKVITDVIPGTILLSVSAGIASIPLLFATTIGVPPRESGLASGVVSTAFTMGSAVGLAVLVSIAAARTEDLLAEGASSSAALTAGYRVAFWIAAGCALIAALISAVFLPRSIQVSTPEPDSEQTDVAVAVPGRDVSSTSK